MGLMGNELTKTAKEEINQSSKKKEIGLQKKRQGEQRSIRQNGNLANRKYNARLKTHLIICTQMECFIYI